VRHNLDSSCSHSAVKPAITSLSRLENQFKGVNHPSKGYNHVIEPVKGELMAFGIVLNVLPKATWSHFHF